MITFQSEQLATCWEEINQLLYDHYDEVALDHEAIPLDPDWAAYQNLENLGKLHITTCRRDGKVIGYYVVRVDTSPHYKSSLHGFVDVYFILAEYRQGKVGWTLFAEAEKALKVRGVVKLMSGTKLHTSNRTGKSLDISRLFAFLGWRETERLYTKLL